MPSDGAGAKIYCRYNPAPVKASSVAGTSDDRRDHTRSNRPDTRKNRRRYCAWPGIRPVGGRIVDATAVEARRHRFHATQKKRRKPAGLRTAESWRVCTGWPETGARAQALAQGAGARPSTCCTTGVRRTRTMSASTGGTVSSGISRTRSGAVIAV